MQVRHDARRRHQPRTPPHGTLRLTRNKETTEVVAIKKFKENDEDEVLKKTTLREVKILRMLRFVFSLRVAPRMASTFKMHTIL